MVFILTIKENTDISVELSKRESSPAKVQAQRNGAFIDSIPDSSEKSKGKEQKSVAEVDSYKPYTPPAYATMPEYSAPLEGKYDYQGEVYFAANGLKLFSKYSVDTARDYIMSELMLSEGERRLYKC